ncbi:hypothetical protein PI124_g10109 [Phytophthora idaei]|nr:hypothetical protein PI125_g22190 [Phytophthora idaei]KAG3130580.1 hypothetical protein PI126_g20435 [Phytophthora idaei]KAG3245131.1 hypothetical protein PI124_g10109 [Phytophthora idaei]
MVDKYKPTGRTTWEVAAAEYSSKRARSRAQRDFDSLHRKFRNLYGMPKHTGNQGDTLTLRQRPIMLAHEIQYEFESKGGVHTTHDERDEGSKTKQSGARLTRIARKTRRLTKMIRGARWKARSRPSTGTRLTLTVTTHFGSVPLAYAADLDEWPSNANAEEHNRNET